MSLVGSLEDLGLGDILQIIHLSGKSGVLVLRTESTEAEVVFDRGLIRAAFRKKGPTTLVELLVSKGAGDIEALTAAVHDARNRGRALVSVLTERAVVDAETIDALKREHIESALLEMFSWPTGDFSFEVREVQDDEDEFYASPGVNPQFIALEGTRMADEAFLPGHGDEAPAHSDEPLEAAHRIAEAVVEVEAHAELELSPISETDLLAPYGETEAPVELAPEAGEEVAEATIEDALVDDESADPASVVSLVAEELPVEDAVVTPTDGERSVGPGPLPPLVLVDPDLPTLEWAKTVLAEAFPQVHIFQRTDLAITRIRQYLARAQVPMVVLSSDVPKDPLSGASGPFELIRRLRRQSGQMPVALLASPGAKVDSPIDARPSVVVRKPGATDLNDPRRVEQRAQIGAELVAELRAAGTVASPGPARSGPTGQPDSGALARLRETSARIREGSAHGEVLPQVLEFASQTFARVALFMIRDEQALGIAQVGLHRAGGPDEGGLREIHVDAREPGWFRTVLDRRAPYRGAPADEGDQRLAVLLGNEIPEEAYVAPVQTADRIVAILYGDNLPGREPIGETGALEVLIDSAGIALERTLLERELEAAEG